MIAGKQYTLSFKMKGRFTSYAVAVRADIISSAGTINVGTLNNTSNGPWITGSYTFTAASATNTLKFVTFSSGDRKSTRLKSQSLMRISYAVFCLKTQPTINSTHN